MIRSDRVWGIAFILILLGGASLLWWSTLNRQRVQKSEDDEEELGSVVKIGVTIANDEELERYLPIIELAEEDIAAFCEEMGSPFSFEFVVRNCESPQAAVDLTKEFHENGTDLIVGHPWSSMMGHAVQEYIAENDMLLLSPSSTSLHWRIPDDNMFRLSCQDLLQASVIAEALHSLDVKGIVIVEKEDTYFGDLCDEIEARYRAVGGMVAGRVPYDPIIRIEPPAKTDKPQSYVRTVEREDYRAFLVDAETFLNETMAEHGMEHVAVVYAGFFEVMNISVQAMEFPVLSAVPWFGSDFSVDVFQYSLHKEVKGSREATVQLGLIGPSASPAYSKEYWGLNERYENMTGLQLDSTGSNYYDGCWLYALSVIEASSTDVTLVKGALREIARDYIGVSGHCELDENDDRLRGHYDVMGYFDVDGECQSLMCGFFNATTGAVTWDERLIRPLGGGSG